MKRLLAVGCATLLLYIGAAHAGEWYVGGGLGQATPDDVEGNAAATLRSVTKQLTTVASGVSSTSSYDRRGTTYSILGGYKFNPYLALEATYDYLGKYTFNATFIRTDATFTRVEQDTVTAISVTGVLNIPIKKVAVIYGKFGLATTTDEISCSGSSGICTAQSDTRTNGTGGIGVGLRLGRNEVRLEYDEFQDVGIKGEEYTAGNIPLVKLVYVYNFKSEPIPE